MSALEASSDRIGTSCPYEHQKDPQSNAYRPKGDL